MPGYARKAALLMYVFVITALLQFWVGSATLYSNEWRELRLDAHDSLLGKKPPSPEMTRLDPFVLRANSRRFVIPWIAEGIVHLFGSGREDLATIYFWIDFLCLYFSLLLLYGYLQTWFDAGTSLFGISYVGLTLVTTYHLHWFHPWDRPVFLLWLATAILVRNRKVGAYLIVLALALLTKFTAALLPLLFVLVYLENRSELRKARFYLILLAQAVIVLACHLLLDRIALVSGSELAGSYFTMIGKVLDENIRRFSLHKLTHPAVLTLGLPLLLIAVGWKRLDHYMKSSVVFAVSFLAFHFALSYFAETRATAPALIFLMPPALKGLSSVIRAPAAPGTR